MLRSLSSRRMAPVVVLVSAALLVSGCGGKSKDKKKDDSPTASSTPAAGSCDYKSGDSSDAVKVTGDFGKTLKGDFKTPLKATSLQRTIITKGDGATTASGDNLNVEVSAFLGSSGKALTTEPAKFKVGDTGLPAAFDASISCVPIGSRVAVTVPASDIYGEAGNPQLGIKGTDTLIIVADVISKVKPLKPASWTNAPAVSFGKNGTPKVTLSGKPDPELRLKVLKQGTGAVVASGDSVTVNYQGTSWNTKKIFDQSYGKAPATFTTDGVVQGFGAALVGQKVGTRLIVTIPPKYGYGEGKISSANLTGQTLVFVIEIQNTAAPSATPSAN
ncbi:FKBP-type peptidyl-prolyl cis-trans isomerase [Nocardioides marmorisolisilvae]|nr:FKBP-type peptidyl-prolyl cis-trans isomerase [Nocardioides marmorisolisilvae]